MQPCSAATVSSASCTRVRRGRFRCSSRTWATWTSSRAWTTIVRVLLATAKCLYLHGAPPTHNHILLFHLVCTVGILGRVYFDKEEAVGWYHIPIALEELFNLHEKDSSNSSELPSVPTFYVGMCPSFHLLCSIRVHTRIQYLESTRRIMNSVE